MMWSLWIAELCPQKVIKKPVQCITLVKCHFVWKPSNYCLWPTTYTSEFSTITDEEKLCDGINKLFATVKPQEFCSPFGCFGLLVYKGEFF